MGWCSAIVLFNADVIPLRQGIISLGAALRRDHRVLECDDFPCVVGSVHDQRGTRMQQRRQPGSRDFQLRQHEDDGNIGTNEPYLLHRELVRAAFVNGVEDGAMSALDGGLSSKVPAEDVNEIGIVGEERSPGDTIAPVPGGL
jgi:hypothetical protein